jgi:NAD(P)-dependent dehydrogenase (short-subunit alcohol dehydrogenase family)
MNRLSPLFDLAGRRALVTGGNSGLGLAMARALGLQGAAVHLAARSAERLDAAARALAEEGIDARPHAADLGDAAALAGLAEDAGPIDILVNAAGMNLRQPFGSVTAEAFDLHMAIHLRAPFLLTQALAPGMKAVAGAGSSTSPRSSRSAPSPIRHPMARRRAASCS